MSRPAPIRRALVAAATGAAVLAPATGVAAGRVIHPELLSPKARAVVKAGTAPTFTVKDTSRKRSFNRLFITVSRSPKLARHGSNRGRLSQGRGGDYGELHRAKGHPFLFTYRPHLYTFPTYFLQRPGRYYWQVDRVDCTQSSTCEVTSRVRSFVVR